MANLYDARGNVIAIDGSYLSPITYTVGQNGNFRTLNEAFTAATDKYPAYKKGGVKVRLKILAGTTINEQIAVVGADFSYVTIIAEDKVVPVNVDGFSANGLDQHDLRTPNVGAFIGGENGAGLPTIGCVFEVAQNTRGISVVGYFANRSSKGVVLANNGFIGFNDGVIANNESSITIREGTAKNMARWGVHARHNGEVSARSAVLTNCKGIAAYADRVANLDVREADLSNSVQAIQANNASQICANGAHYAYTDAKKASCLVSSNSGSMIACGTMEIKNPNCTTIFGVSYGGLMVIHGLTGFSNQKGCKVMSKAINAINMHGIIFSDSTYAG